MDENGNRTLSVETYISKQESLLVDHIRRLLQTETKVALLETGIQELHKKNKELSEQLEICNVTIDQSLNGLKAVTHERDKLVAENEKLNASLNSCNALLNEKLVVETELNIANEKLRVVENDYSTLKENYNRVLAMLPQSDAPELESTTPKKSKKTKSTDPEWIDGQY